MKHFKFRTHGWHALSTTKDFLITYDENKIIEVKFRDLDSILCKGWRTCDVSWIMRCIKEHEVKNFPKDLAKILVAGAI